jgi:hypothetical protein
VRVKGRVRIRVRVRVRVDLLEKAHAEDGIEVGSRDTHRTETTAERRREHRPTGSI